MIVSNSHLMHPQSHPLTIGGILLKESDGLDILGVTFDSKMTFQKHFRSGFRAASTRLGIWRKFWRVLPDRSFLGRCFRCFALPVLEFCSLVLWSAPDTHLKLLDRIVSGANSLTGGVIECDIVHRRSVMRNVYMIRCNPMHPLYSALPVPYVSVGVTSGALVAHNKYTS